MGTLTSPIYILKCKNYPNISIHICPSALSIGWTEPVTGIIPFTFASKVFIAFSLSATSLAIALELATISPLATFKPSFKVVILASNPCSATSALSFSVTILASRVATAWVLSWTSLAIALAFSSIEVSHVDILPVLTTISSLALSNSERIAPTPAVIPSTVDNLPSNKASALLYSASTWPIEVSNPVFIPSTSSLV